MTCSNDYGVGTAAASQAIEKKKDGMRSTSEVTWSFEARSVIQSCGALFSHCWAI